VQDDVAGAVIKALKVSLMGDAMPKAAGTQNPEAYNLYLQASSIWLHKSTQADYQHVVDYLRSALSADPAFAPAWALLCDALSAQGGFGYVGADGHVALASLMIGSELDAFSWFDPLLRNVQSDLRFKALLLKVGLAD
jgi:hypothetical protein